MSCHVSIPLWQPLSMFILQHTPLSTQITHRFMKALPSFTQHVFFSSSALHLKLFHKCLRGDQLSHQYCLPKISVLVLVFTACCPALSSLLSIQMQVISKVVPLSFAIAVTHFSREVRNLAVVRLGRSRILSFAFLIFLPPSLRSLLEQAGISPSGLTPLLPMAEIHVQLCELTDPQATLVCWRQIVYLGMRLLAVSIVLPCVSAPSPLLHTHSQRVWTM